jgi:hypothetical protein
MVKLRKINAGRYVTLDGRYEIDQQPYERECDCVACQVGGICAHGGTATDWFWIIWDTETDDYADGTHLSSFDTLREAKEWLAPMVATLNEGVTPEYEKPLVRAEREPVKASEHVGTEGGTLAASLTVEQAIPLVTKYGEATLYRLTDADGNTFKWITKSDEYGEGDRLTATWTIKEHGEWKGVKETAVKLPSGLVVEAGVAA